MRAKRKTRSSPGKALRIALGTILATVFMVVIGAAAAYGIINDWLQDLPDYNAPDAFEVAQATRIYSADGVLLARLFLENRTVVPISRISTYLVEATVAVEDERFYQHNGIDLRGLT